MLVAALQRFETMLHNKQDHLAAAARSDSTDATKPETPTDPTPEGFAHPMQANISWVPPKSAHNPRIEITVNDETTAHDTWFKSKDSAQQFLDALKDQVRPDTTPCAFAELVAAFMFLQRKRYLQSRHLENIITILNHKWPLGRRQLPAAITPSFFQDSINDPQPLHTQIISDRTYIRLRSMSMRRRSAVHWLVWDIPSDVNHVTIALTTAECEISDDRPSLTRLMSDAPHKIPCSLIYAYWFEDAREFTHLWLHSPQRVHEGQVNWVEYMGYQFDFETCRTEAIVLAALFKSDADPVVVGLFLNTLKRLQYYPRDDRHGFQPEASTAHHWLAVWPIKYKAQIESMGSDESTMEHFFTGLIQAAHPDCTVQGGKVKERERTGSESEDDIVPQGEPPLHYEFSLPDLTDPETSAPVERLYECVADARYIKIRVVDRLTDASSKAGTREAADSQSSGPPFTDEWSSSSDDDGYYGN
jgi:hypothetical protein